VVTIKDIAARSNVSTSTVSRVLNSDKTISVTEETRQRIIDVAKELGYKTVYERRITQQNTFKSNGENPRIGIVLCQSIEEELSDPYFLSIRQGVEQELVKQEITNSRLYRLDELNSIDVINDIDGLIVIGKLSEKTLVHVSNHIENVVYINHSPDDERYDSVVIDFESATEKVMNHLLNHGYKHIGYIGGEERLHSESGKVTVEDKRLTIYESVLKDHGVYNPNDVYVSEYRVVDGYELMKKALKKEQHPEAFFIASDPMAIGALRALQEANIKVPKDVAIVSFDDIEMAAFASTPLTTIKVRTKEMGRTGVKLLLDRFAGRSIPLKVIVPTELVIKESCGTKG